MNGLELIRLIICNFKLIMISTTALLVVVFITTMNEKKEYASHTLLNTGLISGYNIESEQSGRVDYAYTNNEIENLINVATATETMVELSLRLLIRCLKDQSAEKLDVLESTSEEIDKLAVNLKYDEIKHLSEDSIYVLWENLFISMKESKIYLLLHSKHSFFGLDQLKNIKVTRQGKSDMINMKYRSFDPRICQLTLDLLTKLFLQKHTEMKQGQSSSVVDFFKNATDMSAQKLHKSENALLNFSIKNKIINYYEQTRFISGNKQELDKQYQDKLKILAGTDSAILVLEKQLDKQRILPTIQSNMVSNQSKISDLVSEIAVIDLLHTEHDATTVSKRQTLKSSLDSLRNDMSIYATSIINMKVSPDGVHTKDMLVQWLNNFILREESKAQLAVMKARQIEFKKIYREFAPLGSTLKRLEREIDVAEREYLENLHSYNQARLHKYNTMMSSNLKVIDAPFYPALPEKSRRLLYLILSLLIGIVLSLGIIITLELLNNSLKNPTRSTQIIGLPVMGSLPVIKNNTLEYEKIVHQAMNLFFQQIRLLSIESKLPTIVGIFSTEANEGKSFLMQQISQYCERMNVKSLLVTSQMHENKSSFTYWQYYEAKSNNLYKANKLDQLIEGYDEVLKKNYNYIFLELPSVIHHPYHPELLNYIDSNVLVCNAQRTWTLSDKRALEMFNTASNTAPQIFLNGVSRDVMEEIIGQLPKKRSWIRKKVKSLFVKVGNRIIT